jgi:group I intron endonuclease
MAKIYKITNTKNGKIYIGMTVDTLDQRLKEHVQECRRYERGIVKYKSRLYNAMLADGIQAFTIELIEDNVPRDLVGKREQYYIKLFNTQDDSIGYNISKGGRSGPPQGKHTEQTRLLQSINNKNKIWCYDPVTLEYRKVLPENIPEGFVIGMLESHKAKLKGENNGMYGKIGANRGKKLSEETKKRSSETKKARNKTRNWVWYTNGTEEHWININEKQPPEGFYPGRVPNKNAHRVAIEVEDLIENKIYEFDSYSLAQETLALSYYTIAKAAKTNCIVKNRYKCKISATSLAD